MYYARKVVIMMNNELKKLMHKSTLEMFDLFSEGIIITDENMITQYTNPAFLEFAELRPEQIIGKFFPGVRAKSRLPEVMQSKKPIFNSHKVTPQGPKGESYFESYTDLIPLFKNDQIIGALIVSHSAKVFQVLFDRIKKKSEEVEQLDKQLRSMFTVRYNFERIVGLDSSFGRLSIKASESDAPALLTGESGTGKEVIAQCIHGASRRRRGPFVDINCAALPENLLESELFGYAPGAFTGASKTGKIGLFEVASGGTIFLDEISEMPLRLQGSLLRVIEEKHLRRVGENKNRTIDVRIIAASNKNIEKMVDSGIFRQDLFYRLAVHVIQIPPLRERSRDLMDFINFFLDENRKKTRKPLAFNDEAIQLLFAYDWPGNIREVKNTVDYACDIVDGNIIKATDLPVSVFKKKGLGNVQGFDFMQEGGKTLPEIVDEVEKKLLEQGINSFGTTLEDRKKMAKAMGISIATLYNKLRKHGLL